MNIEDIRTYCLGKPGVTESFPFDNETLVFKVMSKMFALAPLERAQQINLKCDPEWAVELRSEWEEVFPGYHMSKKHWNTVSLNGRLPSELLVKLIDHSYELVTKGLKKSEREALAGM